MGYPVLTNDSIKDCPDCGGASVLNFGTADGKRWAFVNCVHCKRRGRKCHSPTSYRSDAVYYWNNLPAKSVAEQEALAAARARHNE